MDPQENEPKTEPTTAPELPKHMPKQELEQTKSPQVKETTAEIPTAPEQPAPKPITRAEAEQADYEAAGKSVEEEDYSQFIPPVGKQPKHHGKRTLIVFLVLLVLAAVGAAGWYFFLRTKPVKPTSQTELQQSPQKEQTPSVQHYDSTNFGLSFDYPGNWKVSDTGDGKLTVTSPAMQLTDATGQTQNGQVVVSIQKKDSADLSAFKTGSAVAVLKSEKVQYTNPSSTQRKSTYISYLQYADTTVHGALDAVYVTGDLGYQYKQQAPESDIIKVDPIIVATFKQCDDTNCKKVTPMSVQSSSWQKDVVATQVVALFKSIKVD